MVKILIAEDDTFLANAYRVKFTKSGDDVKIASDGKEALAIAASFHPEVILMDLVMPNMDGFAALSELKKNPITKHISVIIASNLGQKEDVDKALGLGASSFIIKSDISISSLVEKVHALALSSSK